MRKIRLSSHFLDRWEERVGVRWTTKQITNYIYRHFMPKLREGIRPYIIDGEAHFVSMIGKLEEKLIFVVLVPDSRGLWSGWTCITVLTDNDIDNIGDYLNWLYERGEE